MKIKVLFFAKIEELVGISEEIYDVEGNVQDLLLLVKEKHTRLGNLISDILQNGSDTAIALNMHLTTEFLKPLQENDEVAFIPPISGG